MLINLTEAIQKHGLKIMGVIHVGGHLGQELTEYQKNGIKDIVFIEPCKETFLKLKDIVGDKATCFNVACGEEVGQMVLHKEKANGGMSNSLLKPKGHLDHYPNIQFVETEIVDVRPLDSLPIQREKYNMLMMDVQGAEAMVLRGATETLRGIDIVYTEVNTAELYEGCALVEDLDNLLTGFKRIETKITDRNWGDAIYVRERKVVNVPTTFRPKETRHYPQDNDQPFEEWFAERYDDRYNTSDRAYLPIMWTEYYKQGGYGKHPRSMRLLQDYLNGLDKSKKYFTIIQYDDGCLSDVKHLDLKIYAMGTKGDYQLPLLCKPHGRTEVKKTLFANFIGRETHPIRKEVLKLKGKEGYFISTEPTGLDAYKHIIASSVFTLCPRGYGKTSFRIAEALEQGSIPVYISDEFLEPHGIDFFEYGLKCMELKAETIDEYLKWITEDEIKELQEQGKETYEKYYTYESSYNNIIQSLKQTA